MNENTPCCPQTKTKDQPLTPATNTFDDVCINEKAQFRTAADGESLRDDPQPDDPQPDVSLTPSFADKIYSAINNVIGGDNPNQFFCMGLPGTIINKEQYSYDVKKNEPKPPLVEANESKLVNKLFDACTMTSSDNGRHLQTQYKTALDMLTPRLNSKLFDAKTQLRQVLMTPYPYNFGDGSPTTGMTLQQVFYRLYGVYVEAKQKWAKMQVDKKSELAQKYSGGTVKDNWALQNEYLDWYETTAEPQILGLEEKLGKVLSVFSPGDMEIITGILDSGSGREIAEARQTLANVQKLNPDGGYVYPVTLYPEDWFTLLDNSFMPMDLLESPAALSQKLSMLVAQKDNLTTRINTFLALIPKKEDEDTLKQAADKADKEFSKALANLPTTYTNVTVDMVKTFVDLVDTIPGEEKDVTKVPQSAVARIFGIDAGGVSELVNTLSKSTNACLAAQNALVTAAHEATKAAMKYFEQKNLVQYKTMLTPLQDQLNRVEQDIAELKQQIAVSSKMQQAPKGEDGKREERDIAEVTPNAVPNYFAQVIISSNMKEAQRGSSSSASASQSSCGASFFFGGYSRNTSHTEAVDQVVADKKAIDIHIGMSVAKVKIGREWFNPGVFLLSADMYNTSSTLISPNQDYTEFNDERFRAMNKCVFPCFPTAFVIARDVTIKFSSAVEISSTFAQSVEDHSSSGGGFFIFGGSSSSSSSSSKSNSTATSTAKSVTVRFTSPQILGYYLEATPPDKSSSLSADQTNANEDFISIFDFIKTFQQMLDDYNKKYHQQTLNMHF